MGSNKSLVGKKYPPEMRTITSDMVGNYASATADANPLYLKSDVAPPMIVVVSAIPDGVVRAVEDRDLIGDPSRLLHLLHSEEDIRWRGLVHAGDTLTTTAKVVNIEDKPGGELLTIGTAIYNQKGQLIAQTQSALFIRDKKASGLRREGGRMILPEEPPVTVRWTIAADQSQRYAEASGDRNPIHLDEQAARSAGLPGKILHGLCTMAFTQRAVIDKCAGGDPAKLARLKVRFTKPVLMGDVLTCSLWRQGVDNGRAVWNFNVNNQEGYPVILDGVAEVGSGS